MQTFPARPIGLALLLSVAACDGENGRTPAPDVRTVTLDSGATTAGMTMTDNALESLYAALQARGLPVPVPGVFERAGHWRVMLDTAGVDARLTILYEVAAVAVPEGPVDFIAPVNAFRQVDGRWTDISPLTAPRLPRSVSSALIETLSEAGKMYVFRSESVSIAGTPDAIRSLPRRLKSAFDLLEDEGAQLLKDGFMPASMEP